MKHKLLAAFLALTLAFLALAAPPKPQPTITVSCSACSLNENITYTGSGFRQGISVYLSVEGPTNRAINVNIDSSGGFSVDFGGLLDYEKGSYTVTANAISKKGATPLASSRKSFQVPEKGPNVGCVSTGTTSTSWVSGWELVDSSTAHSNGVETH